MQKVNGITKKKRAVRIVNKDDTNSRQDVFFTGHKTGLTIDDKYWKLIEQSPFSASLTVDKALEVYFKNAFVSRAEKIIQFIYEEIFALEMLKEKGKMGLVEWDERHQAQIEHYKEAIKILENSPLIYIPDN